MIVNFEFSHSVDRVFEVLTNPEFLKARALKLGSIDAQSEARQTESSHQVTLVRKRKVNVPSVLKAMLKTIQTATTKEQWHQQGDQYRCQNATDIDGAPLSISGQIRLTPTAAGCAFRAEFETDAKVMLFAKKLEKYAGKTVAKEIELECEYTANYLDDDQGGEIS